MATPSLTKRGMTVRVQVSYHDDINYEIYAAVMHNPAPLRKPRPKL
jgi:hypothetical protein